VQRRVDFHELTSAHARNLGCAGSAATARLLAAAADRADSAAERLLIRLLRSAGLTGWVRDDAELRYRIDIAFPGARLAIEVDGWAWHSDAERFRADRSRHNALVNAGWRVLRFTWHDLTGQPDRVIAEIRAALAR
jgi:very-short-patch-repair endonuclease